MCEDEGFVWERFKKEVVCAENRLGMLDVIEVMFDQRALVVGLPGERVWYMVVGASGSGRVLQVVCSDELEPVVRFVTVVDAEDAWRRAYEGSEL